MTTFAPPNSSSAQDLADPPHQDVPPPPQLEHDPFSHQLTAPNPPFSPSHKSNPIQPSRRPSQDFRRSSANGNMSGANGNGPVPVPGGSHGRAGNGHSHGAQMREMGFGGPRSPPNNKSKPQKFPSDLLRLTTLGTSHVPCKFYRQGQCQAGKACPFLHSDEPLAERAPCKYFTKVRIAHISVVGSEANILQRVTASLVPNAPSRTSFRMVKL